MSAPQQPLYTFGGGAGPVMHLALANGFPPGSYAPLLTPFTERCRVVSLPPRGMWPGIGAPPTIPGTWRELADDLLAGMQHYDLRDVIAVGHSFGGVASLLAVLADPARFRALILLDPTILSPTLMDAMRQMRASGETLRLPLVDGALNRRMRFADLEEAFAYWRGKPLFRDWSDEALWHYTRAMTRPDDDDGSLVLSWVREWEAYYDLSFYTDTWHDLPGLAGLLPTLIIGAAKSDAFPAESAAHARALLPQAEHVTIPGYGHLFPQAAPDATRQIMHDWLTRHALI